MCRKKAKVKVKLADGKARAIQHMMVTTFWHPDGTPMSAQQFLETLYGKLPDFFQDEAELRALWSVPDTRAKLLAGLAEQGFGHEQMAEMQRDDRRREERPVRCAGVRRRWRRRAAFQVDNPQATAVLENNSVEGTQGVGDGQVVPEQRGPSPPAKQP